METPSKTSRKEVHLRDYLVVLDRHKWLIIAAVVVTLSSTVLYLRRQVPFYQAQACVIIEPSRSQEIMYPRSAQTIGLDLKTQIEVIKTKPVLASVVKQLGLSAAPEGTGEFSAVIGRLKRSIRIGFVGDTSMVSIAATHFIPEMARDIANAVAQSYIDQDRLSRLQSGRDAVRWLSAQLVDIKTKLRHSEEAFQQFKEHEGIITLDDKRREELDEIYGLNASYLTVRSKRLGIEAIIDKLESEDSVSLSIPVAMLDSSTLQKLGIELNQLQTELADKKKLFKDTYPAIVELRDSILLTEQNILAELKQQRDFLQAQERSFSTSHQTKHQEALKLGRKELEYLTLEREVTTNREIYNTLLAKVKELSLAGEPDLNNIRIVEPASLPLAPIRSNNLTPILGGILGLFLGIGFAFLLEYFEDTIKTPDDVEQHLGLPILGVVPRVEGTNGNRTPPILVQENARNISAESYRSLRTNLLFSGIEDPLKTIMVTSTGPGEGKSITVVNLGMALAQAGQNVLLIDADLRRPMLHRVFGADRHKGLSAVLAEELSIEEAVVKADLANLSVLTSGVLPANPSEILGSTQMKNLISHVRERYDIVLFDSAPVLGMTDAAVLAAGVDGTVVVVKTGDATRMALRTALAQLEKVDARTCGVVLNNVDVRRDRYYDYYYYYYYYSSYEDDESRFGTKPERKREHRGVRSRWKKPKREGRPSQALYRSDYSAHVPLENIVKQNIPRTSLWKRLERNGEYGGVRPRMRRNP